MAEFLAARGHSVTVYTAFSYYPAWAKSKADQGRFFASEEIAGVAVRNGAALAKSIEALRADPGLRASMAVNGRSYALANLASKAILEQFERDLLAIAS